LLLPMESPLGSLAMPVECGRIVLSDERAPDGPPTRIDHPPQLA
jgi:hypothetical protein